MRQPCRSLRRCRKIRRWQTCRPHPRTGLQARAMRRRQSTETKGQARAIGQEGWQTLDDPGRSGEKAGGPPSPVAGISSRSGTLTAALVGLGVIVAALLANPIADQVLGAVELL